MNNPFENIDERLSNIEKLLLNLKLPIQEVGNNSEQLLTVQECADFLKLTKPTIYSKVSKGELPYMKRSKRLYFSKAELTEYLKKGRIKTNEEVKDDAHNNLK